MLLVLMAVLLRVHAEWVEIAQNTYRRNTLKKPPVATEFAPEFYTHYPNATFNADWHRGHVSRVGEVRRVPQRRPGEGATNKQEYYDIDGPDQLTISDDVGLHERDHTEVPVRLHDIENVRFHSEANKWKDTRVSSLDRGQMVSDSHEADIVENTDFKSNASYNAPFIPTGWEGGELSENKYSQQTVLDQVDHHIMESTNQGDTHKQINHEDHFNLNKIMQHLIDNFKPNEGLNSETDKSKEKHIEPIKNTSPRTHNFEEYIQKPSVNKEGLEKKDNKYFTGILRMFKTVANIISKNTQRSVNSKVEYLKKLKNTILYNIQERINAVWPEAGAGRAARTTEGRGHMELPSSEGALMTISFLTFAVFLIKLVLQIIHTYKNKTMMMTPAVVTAVGRTAAAALTKN